MARRKKTERIEFNAFPFTDEERRIIKEMWDHYPPIIIALRLVGSDWEALVSKQKEFYTEASKILPYLINEATVGQPAGKVPGLGLKIEKREGAIGGPYSLQSCFTLVEQEVVKSMYKSTAALAGFKGITARDKVDGVNAGFLIMMLGYRFTYTQISKEVIRQGLSIPIKGRTPVLSRKDETEIRQASIIIQAIGQNVFPENIPKRTGISLKAYKSITEKFNLTPEPEVDIGPAVPEEYIDLLKVGIPEYLQSHSSADVLAAIDYVHENALDEYSREAVIQAAMKAGLYNPKTAAEKKAVFSLPEKQIIMLLDYKGLSPDEIMEHFISPRTRVPKFKIEQIKNQIRNLRSRSPGWFYYIPQLNEYWELLKYYAADIPVEDILTGDIGDFPDEVLLSEDPANELEMKLIELVDIFPELTEDLRQEGMGKTVGQPMLQTSVNLEVLADFYESQFDGWFFNTFIASLEGYNEDPFAYYSYSAEKGFIELAMGREFIAPTTGELGYFLNLPVVMLREDRIVLDDYENDVFVIINYTNNSMIDSQDMLYYELEESLGSTFLIKPLAISENRTVLITERAELVDGGAAEYIDLALGACDELYASYTGIWEAIRNTTISNWGIVNRYGTKVPVLVIY